MFFRVINISGIPPCLDCAESLQGCSASQLALPQQVCLLWGRSGLGRAVESPLEASFSPKVRNNLHTEACNKYVNSCLMPLQINHLQDGRKGAGSLIMTVLSPQSYKVPRSSQRTFMHAAAEVRCAAVPGVHAGVLRDISEDGVFFYSDFKPPLGTEVRIIFIPAGFGRPRIYCEGRVVRVEQVRTGAAPGIAVHLTNRNAVPIRNNWEMRCSA